MQLTLNLEAGLSESYGTCRELVASRVHSLGKPQKAIAADMDLSPSDLTRKCAQSPNDCRRFTLDDLERFIEVTGDTQPVLYLVEKFFTDSTSRIEQLEKELQMLKAKGASQGAKSQRMGQR